jgi:NitT/TauT family transport system substrate-binding protein
MEATTRRKFLKTVTVGVGAAAGAFPLLSSAQGVSFKIGPVVLQDLATVAPVLIAIEKGYFRDNGIAAEMIPFRGGPDLLKGVLAGTVEMGVSGGTDVLVFRERGTLIRAVAVIIERNHFALLGGPDVKSPEDLKGGTIGVTVVGATTWVFARLIAKRYGWDPERDVRIIGVGGMEGQVAALRRREIQGLVTSSDGGVIYESQGLGRVLMRLDEVTPKWMSHLAYATEETIRTKKDTLRKVLQAYFRGIKYCRENRDEAVRVAAKSFGLAEAVLSRVYDLVSPLMPADGRIDVEALRVMQETLFELGLLKKRLPLEDHYTTEFTPVKL